MTKEQGDRMIVLLEEILVALKSSKGGISGFKEGVFTGWKAVRVPSWATYDAGIQFGDLSKKSLEYWIKWEPKGYKGQPPKPDDLVIRRALDEAQAEIAAGTYSPPQYTNKPKEARPPKPKAETPVSSGPDGQAAEINDEDVPF